MLLATLADLHHNFSDLLNEPAPPAPTDALYQSRTRWFNRGQEDLAKRWFFKPLLKSATISIISGTATYQMPTDFDKPNGLRVFYLPTSGVLFTDPYDTSGTVLSVTRNFTTGGYEITITPTPGAADTATVRYTASADKGCTVGLFPHI